jgi:hypothetical protein
MARRGRRAGLKPPYLAGPPRGSCCGGHRGARRAADGRYAGNRRPRAGTSNQRTKAPAGVNSTISLGCVGSALTASPLAVSKFPFGTKARASGPRKCSLRKTIVPGPAELGPGAGMGNRENRVIGRRGDEQNVVRSVVSQTGLTENEGAGVGLNRISGGNHRGAGYGHRRRGKREIEARHRAVRQVRNKDAPGRMCRRSSDPSARRAWRCKATGQ